MEQYATLRDDPVIVWCAGAGVANSPQEIFDAEAELFGYFLERLGTWGAARLNRTRIVFASSAGAVYAGVEDPPYTEASPTQPLAAYGVAKLEREAQLRDFAAASGARTVAARISNLYGPGQNLAKQQGLISTLLLGYLAHKPVQIYVSLDTVRDYLYVSDAAELMMRCVARVAREPAGSHTVKVLASGQGTTIGALLNLTRQVIGHPPLIVQGASPHARVQARDLSMTSIVWPEVDRLATTTMVDGIQRTYLGLIQHQCQSRWELSA